MLVTKFIIDSQYCRKLMRILDDHGIKHTHEAFENSAGFVEIVELEVTGSNEETKFVEDLYDELRTVTASSIHTEKRIDEIVKIAESFNLSILNNEKVLAFGSKAMYRVTFKGYESNMNLFYKSLKK
jgi:hypothetical protein